MPENSKYKVEYIHTSPDHKKWYKQKNAVDGWSLAKELEALLADYEQKGYALRTMEPIMSPDSLGRTRTDGILVVLGRIGDEL